MSQTVHTHSETASTGSAGAHLQSYPLVSETLTYLAATRVGQGLAPVQSTLALLFQVILLILVISALVSRIDTAIDQLLTKLDARVPGIQNLTYQSLYPAVVIQYIVAFARSRVSAAAGKFEENRPLILARIDPVFAPVNKVIESCLEYLPEGTEVAGAASTPASRDEIAKFSGLATTAYNRAAPVALAAARDMQAVPANVSAHVTKIYANQLENDLNKSRAVAKTGIELGTEIGSQIRPVIEPLVGRVSTFAKSTQNKVEDVVGNAKINVDKVLAQVAQGGAKPRVVTPVAVGAD